MINLFLEYFKNTDKNRDNEVIQAINNNINSNLFTKIYIFTQETIIDIQFSLKVEIIKINQRLTFRDMFYHINSLTNINSINVICNNDIYFDNTINILIDYNLDNKFLAILRRDVLKDGTSKLFQFEENDCFNRKGYRTDSHGWLICAPSLLSQVIQSCLKQSSCLLTTGSNPLRTKKACSAFVK